MIRVASIQAAVAEVFDVPVEAMRERDGFGSRARDRVYARQEAMFLCRESITTPYYQGGGHRIPLSFPRIGKLFGGRDHSTVIHAVRAVEKRLADPEVRRRIDSLSVSLLLRELAP